MANTARSTLRANAMRRGRIPETVANSVIDGYLNDAAVQFQKDTHLLRKFTAFNVHAKFSMLTTEAFNLTLAKSGGYVVDTIDVALSTAQTDVTGAALATALQAIIQASGVGATATTMAFDEDTRQFTLEASAESSTVTSFTVTYPEDHATYNDASYMLFGETTTATGTTFEGAPAPYCTSEYKLPTDFLAVEELVYDGKWDRPLKLIPYRLRSKSIGGSPKYMTEPYEKSNGEWYLKVTPQPTTIGKRFDLAYYYRPAKIATGTATDATTYDFLPDWDLALENYAIMEYYQQERNMEESLYWKAMYQEWVDKAEIEQSVAGGQAYDMFSGRNA
jgi:hypothetical protein